MLTKVFASLGLLICVALALHMCLGRRQQLWLERRWESIKHHLDLRLGWRFDGRERRRVAHQATMDAIARAKRRSAHDPAPVDGSWEGNIYRPKAFEGKTQRKLN
jgi:hypothetical protein